MPELLVILVIVFFIFGPKRLKNIGSDLGNAIKGFRTAVSEEEEQKNAEAKVIEGEAQSQERTETQQQDSKV